MIPATEDLESPLESEVGTILADDFGAPLLEDAPSESGESTGCVARLLAWGRGILEYCAISIATLTVCFACALPGSDFLLDTTLVLPTYLRKDMFESFEVQLGGILVGTVLGYAGFVSSHGLWHKLSVCPYWLRGLLIVGGFFTFPLAPFFVMFQALVGFAVGSKKLLNECSEAVPIVTSGEFFESLIGVCLQLKAYVLDDVNLWVSVLTGFLSAIKASLSFDLSNNKLLTLTWARGGGDAASDHEIHVVTGLLPSLTSDLGRTALLASHRALEIFSGVSCGLLFHRMAYDRLSVGGFSLAGPAFFGAQIVFAALYYIARRRYECLWQAVLVPLCVPLPLYDAFYGRAWEYTTRALSQAVVFSVLASSHDDRHGWYRQDGVVEVTWLVFVTAAGIASSLMWASLLVISAVPACPPMDRIQDAALTCAQLIGWGAQLRNCDVVLARPEWGHPCADSFKHTLWGCLLRTYGDDGGWASDGAVTLKAYQMKTPEAFRMWCLCMPHDITAIQLDLKHCDTLNNAALRALPASLTSLVIDFSECSNFFIDDECLWALPAGLVHLEVGLKNSLSISDEGLKALPAGLAHLKLDLSGISGRVHDEGLKALPAGLTSLVLHLNGNDRISNEGLKDLPAGLTSLELTTSGIFGRSYTSVVNSEGLKALPAGLAHLKLDIQHVDNPIGDDGLKVLPAGLASLQLICGGNSDVSDEGLKALPAGLTSLELDPGSPYSILTNFSDEGIKALPAGLTNLALSLRQTERISDEALKALPAGLTSLQLDLRGTKGIGDRGLQALPAGLTSLRLDLRQNEAVSDEGLRALPAGLQILELDLRQNRSISNRGLEALPAGLASLKLHGCCPPNRVRVTKKLRAALPTGVSLEVVGQ